MTINTIIVVIKIVIINPFFLVSGGCCEKMFGTKRIPFFEAKQKMAKTAEDDVKTGSAEKKKKKFSDSKKRKTTNFHPIDD